jgi:hypothetical protein
MRFLKDLYVGEGIKNRQRVQWKLKHGAGMKDVYVISIAAGNDQLDCMHCAFFKQKAIREYTGTVVGLAKGYEEALQLIQTMAEDSLRETGTANIKEYLSTRK